MTANEEKINAMFDRLVPMSGKADTVAGEIVRAISRITHRNYNDGDHLGIGYGRETVNPAARFLSAKCDDRVAGALSAAWGIENEDAYSLKLEAAEAAVLAYLNEHPELETKENTEDMWDYMDEYEDVDRDEDYDEYEDDYYYDEDDDEDYE